MEGELGYRVEFLTAGVKAFVRLWYDCNGVRGVTQVRGKDGVHPESVVKQYLW